MFFFLVVFNPSSAEAGGVHYEKAGVGAFFFLFIFLGWFKRMFGAHVGEGEGRERVCSTYL